MIQRLALVHDGLLVAALLPRNGGASNARNVGTSLCRSPWVAFLDSDDLWLPGAASAMLAASDGSDVICGHFARVEEQGEPGNAECGWWGDDIRVALSHGGAVGPSWSIIRRATVTDVKGFDTSLYKCNDWKFYTRVAASGATFRRIDTVVALYRTVTRRRLVDDITTSAENARRVLAHPYLARPVCG